jgi:AcrR family transcriptional regulator
MRVDHDERRRKVAEATASVIAEEGLESAKIRRIAEAIGKPTKHITYYFTDKDELLKFTYENLVNTSHLTEYFEDPTRRETQRPPPSEPSRQDSAALVEHLMAMAAADETSVRRWRAYLAFFDQAARDPALAEMQRLHTDVSIARATEAVRATFGDCEDLERVSLLLKAAVQGISLQALVDPERWPPERMREELGFLVEALLHDQDRRAGAKARPREG